MLGNIPYQDHKVGDKVTLKAGTKVGNGQLKADTAGEVARVDYSEEGFPIYCIRLDSGRATWITG